MEVCPHFSPTGVDLVANQVTATAYTDTLSDPSLNAFYVVTAAEACGPESAGKNRLGIFNFTLQPGQ